MRARHALCFGIFVLGCTPLGDDSTDAANDAPDGADADVVAAPDDAGVGDGCAKQQPVAYVTLASGTISGWEVSASYCGAFAYLYMSPYTTPKNDVLLFFDTIDGVVHVDTPPSATLAILSGMMQVSAAAPGVYTSTGSCGFLSFTYWLPPPSGVDCMDASGPSCPTGCSSVCSSQGCLPCEPVQPEVVYGASGVSDCLQSGQATTVGSWTITLTSVTPYTGSANDNGPHYIVHGTLDGALPGSGGGSVNVTATF